MLKPSFLPGTFLARFTLLCTAFLLPNTASAEAIACNASAGAIDEPHQKIFDKQLVIIIDDLGHSLQRGQQALALPGSVTYAIMPYTQYGERLAQSAHEAGKEVMLHAPMSTVEGDPLGEGGLTPKLSRSEFNTRFTEALAEVPHAQGINNHMGSDLTQRRMQMAWLMQELRWQDLYFVDSRTSGKTVAAKVASEFNVPNLSRETFLDNDRDRKAIDDRFSEVLRKVEQKGLAVAIGHPYPETIRYLEEALPLLAERGVQLVSVSQALQMQMEEAGKDSKLSLAGIELLQPEC